MGKTAVAAGPYTLPQNANKTTLMISPLIGLQNEMVNTFRDEYKMDAIAVNSAHETSWQTLQEIINGKYRIVLLSPEMLLSRPFIDRVLRHRKFAANILSIVVDEAHCISHWGADFRKKYGQIGTARAFLPRSTPVIALSASLTRRVKRDVIEVLQMQGRTHPKFFLNAGNDRGNVSIVVRPIHNPMNTYSDLDFVIPPSTTRPENIPKTWIYVDDINAGGEIIDHLCTLLPEHLRGVIRPYNAILSPDYRDEAMQLFKQGNVRVLVCTDAAGMGCNIPDIEVVVQWKLPGKLSNFVQRAGRAARDPDIRGLAVLLVEPSAYNVDLLAGLDAEVATTEKTEKGGKGGKRRRRKKPRRKVVKGKEYANLRGRQRGARSGKKDDFPPGDVEQCIPRHDDDAEGLYHVVQSRTCRREVIVGMFDSVKTVSPGVECCDICAPSLLDRTRPGKNSRAAAAPRLTMAKTRDASLYAVMDDWREEVFDRDFSWSGMTPEMVLPTTLIDKIARIQQPLKRTVIERLLKLDWLYYDQYGQEMLDRFPRSTFPLAFDTPPSPPATISADVPRPSSSFNPLNSRSATDAGLVDEQRRGTAHRRSRARSYSDFDLYQPSSTASDTAVAPDSYESPSAVIRSASAS
ncbi:P-loop containing nucleoside triphosphate hydrolase protein [Schizophyllum commune H4-8]|uniref:P-loop containing nucleoside triphosphate hydrolase protein n=1 Tax=Schizophyllum commune (strain H4-8 / FGSC 9210) TaxID=578458 RepID=UPI00215E6ABA|nr:P-loop containing nucleoside triphosphate hydrolase protein [Schizophyllum commune H4-8]KAI5891065.1 P-loop containing nucleoside triphosphate hydrolase protein [Schizophyllum commune H4-8]